MLGFSHQPGFHHAVSIGERGITCGIDEPVLLIAGPCAVESHEQLAEVAEAVIRMGAGVLRGGAFKPRTSPHSFQGMRGDGLEILARVREERGIPVVTEVLDPREVEQVAAAADMLQIGARNMSNGSLIREAARAGKPLLLKRGFGATVDELLAAAEYALVEGNDQVVLCERGIRTFESSTRFTLDIAAIAVLRERTHLPIIVDPSHAAGRAALVPSLTLAAIAAGADGVMIEVHPDPASALSDGAQSLSFQQLEDLVARISAVARSVGRGLATVPARM